MNFHRVSMFLACLVAANNNTSRQTISKFEQNNSEMHSNGRENLTKLFWPRNGRLRASTTSSQNLNSESSAVQNTVVTKRSHNVDNSTSANENDRIERTASGSIHRVRKTVKKNGSGQTQTYSVKFFP